MAPASTATREAPASPNDRAAAPPRRPTQSATHGATQGTTHDTGRPIPARASRTATDDEILGLDPAAREAGDAHPVAPAREDPWREGDDSPTSSEASSPQDRQPNAQPRANPNPSARR